MLNFFTGFVAIITDPVSVKSALDKVLSRPEFYPLRSRTANSVLKDFLEKILKIKIVQDFIAGINKAINYISGFIDTPAFSVLALVFSILLLAFIISYIVIIIYRRLMGNVKPREGTDGAESQTGSENPDREAEYFASSGQRSLSISRYYVSLVQQLDRLGILKYSDSRTGREIENLVKGRGSELFDTHFYRLSRLFEQTVYARKEPDDEVFRLFMESLQNCRQEAGSIE